MTIFAKMLMALLVFTMLFMVILYVNLYQEEVRRPPDIEQEPSPPPPPPPKHRCRVLHTNNDIEVKTVESYKTCDTPACDSCNEGVFGACEDGKFGACLNALVSCKEKDYDCLAKCVDSCKDVCITLGYDPKIYDGVCKELCGIMDPKGPTSFMAQDATCQLKTDLAKLQCKKEGKVEQYRNQLTDAGCQDTFGPSHKCAGDPRPPPVPAETFWSCGTECQNRFKTFDDYYYGRCKTCVHECEKKYNSNPYGYMGDFCICDNYNGIFYRGDRICTFRTDRKSTGGWRFKD